ncbi:transglutaminase domain-containing protein [Haloplanus halophilus]|uniref:transglutaminase domain-containing protein n=1 Tax=Haloplanus halophilus TaxID=2949993 RepID=UPI00203B6828|nr:transglutaminase domain-containing protein [Haloplanus sp. GDY1]
MSDSGGDPADGASGGTDAGGVEYGEVAVTLAAVLALVVAAALLPAAGLGSGGGGGDGAAGTAGTATTTPGGTPGDAATGTPEGGSSGDSTTAAPLGGGSPSGVSLSNPPERTAIGSPRPSGAPLAQTPQFVVEAPRNAYWRQTAYSRYTGSAWERSPRWQPMSEGVPDDGRTATGGRMDYEVTLLVPSSSLPTAWRPERVTVPNRSVGVEASTLGGVRTDGSLPAGTTYRARSATPPRSPAALRAAGTDYPPELERRYTQVPAATPRRVGAFTADLTAGAETPYDTAVIVRDWLRTKPYSLNASHEPGEPIADQFVFEMERGYCQYYATSMVVMLRTQGVPARYVVGYAPGERVGENRYLVTADRGHAWVEVYFPEVGWVRFDPTGTGRLPVRNPQPPYDISLNRSAVAGARVAVSVEKNGTPVVGAPVFVDDERVGWTDARGRVTTTLPYDATVTVTARPPDGVTKYDDGTTAASRTTGGTAPVDAARRPGSTGRLAAARPPAGLGQRETPANASSRTYRSDTNVTLSVRGRPVAGGGVTVVAAIRDVPFRGATVTVDGERVGETGANGTAGVSLSGVAPGTHTLRVRRDAVSARTTLRVLEPGEGDSAERAGPDPIAVAVDAPLGLPLPGGPATVTTTRNGSPVRSTVRVDGRTAGRTDANGSLSVTLPVAGSAAVVARGPAGTTDRATVAGLYRNAALLGGVLAALGAVGWWLRRRGVTPRGGARTLATALSTLSARAVAACIRAAELLGAAGRALRRGLRWLAGLPARVATRGLAALAALDPRRLWRWLAGLLARRGSGATGGSDGARGGGEPSATAAGDGAPSTLRSSWREFVALVAPPGARTRTPGEIARYAVDRGLPERPVRILTEAYRDAEYGRLAPDEERLARVREAVAALRAAARGEEP